MRLVKLYLSPAGRIDRRRFWIAWLSFMAVTVLAGWFLFPVMQRREPIPYAIWLALQIYPLACLYSKRIHDLGWPGWAPLPILGFQALAEWATSRQIDAGLERLRQGDGDTIQVGFPWGLVAWIASIALLAVAGLTPGAPGRNKHGDPPGQPAAEEAFE